MRSQTVLTLHQVKTVESKMKIRRMINLTNTPVEDNGCSLNPDSSSVIHMTKVNEAHFRIVAENIRKQDEVKENVK